MYTLANHKVQNYYRGGYEIPFIWAGFSLVELGFFTNLVILGNEVETQYNIVHLLSR